MRMQPIKVSVTYRLNWVFLALFALLLIVDALASIGAFVVVGWLA